MRERKSEEERERHSLRRAGLGVMADRALGARFGVVLRAENLVVYVYIRRVYTYI